MHPQTAYPCGHTIGGDVVPKFCPACGVEMRWEAGMASDRMLQFFTSAHLSPARLREASQDFCDLAQKVVETYPQNPERTVCLRKLLEAKDAAVRTILFVDDGAR